MEGVVPPKKSQNQLVPRVLTGKFGVVPSKIFQNQLVPRVLTGHFFKEKIVYFWKISACGGQTFLFSFYYYMHLFKLQNILKQNRQNSKMFQQKYLFLKYLYIKAIKALLDQYNFLLCRLHLEKYKEKDCVITTWTCMDNCQMNKGDLDGSGVI